MLPSNLHILMIHSIFYNQCIQHPSISGIPVINKHLEYAKGYPMQIKYGSALCLLLLNNDVFSVLLEIQAS